MSGPRQLPKRCPDDDDDAQSGQVRSYIGAGKAPAAATIDLFRSKGYENVSDIDIWSQLLPASPDVMIALLRDYGTLSFSEVAASAILIAEEGFPATRVMLVDISNLSLLERIGYTFVFSYNAEVYMHKEWWRPMHPHDRMRFPDLANTFRTLVRAEQGVLQAGGSRLEGLQAVRDEFYQGSIAEKIVAFHQEKGGLFTFADLAGYTGGWEEPVSGSYGPYTLYTNGGWSQGMVGPLALQILEGINLKSMSHNTPQYIHTVVQAIELAQADREAYVGDPAFVDTPMDVLMSKEYAAQRGQHMTASAFGPLPPPGELNGLESGNTRYHVTGGAAYTAGIFQGLRIGQDTTQLAIVDS
jgi:gamma-glutamyltranspeptidase/glutathione hydrolase